MRAISRRINLASLLSFRCGEPPLSLAKHVGMMIALALGEGSIGSQHETEAAGARRHPRKFAGFLTLKEKWKWKS
jgi:hypothetical protein